MTQTRKDNGLQLSDFWYDLPEELIAQTPANPRDSSRLLVYSDKIYHRNFSNITEYLKKGDVLVVNNTKVIPARLVGHKDTGAEIEVLLLKRLNLSTFEVLVKPGKKARIGDRITFSSELSCKILDRTDAGGRVIELAYSGVLEDILSRVGSMPLPHYIKTPLSEQERYQTVYCKVDGSSASPTAGLHFTPQLIEQVKQMGVEWAEVLLHVGLGTFRPVKVQDITSHQMHSEYYEVSPQSAAVINRAKAEGRRVIAVGTTSVRVLESATKDGELCAGKGDTSIFIYPSYKFKMVDKIITNFHLPESTLLMLVSAFIGRENVLRIYNEAIAQGYRFFSFGDAMFI